MADPYRRRHDEPPAELSHRRPGLASVAFGLVCAVVGAAFTGSDRVRCMLIATAAGTVLIVVRQEPERFR